MMENQEKLSTLACYESYKAVLSYYEDPRRVFHSNGIDEKLYEVLSNTPSALLIDGIPYAVSIQDAEMIVSVERCKNLVKNILGNVEVPAFISLLPVEAIVHHSDKIREIIKAKLNYNGPIAIFGSHDLTDQSIDDFNEYASDNSVIFHELVHPKTKTEASLNLFELDVTVRQDNDEDERVSLVQAVDNLYSKEIITDDGGHLIIRIGGEFTKKEEESLWQLFGKRFEDISENMPLELAESEESTKSLLRDGRNVFVYKRNEGGKIISCIFISDKREAYPWVNAEFLDEKMQGVNRSEVNEMFIPGIAAYKEDSRKSAFEMISVLAKLGVNTGKRKILIRFECTDVSSLYIPRITKSALSETGLLDNFSVKQIGHKAYLLMSL